jgi:hypothetical protein
MTRRETMARGVRPRELTGDEYADDGHYCDEDPSYLIDYEGLCHVNPLSFLPSPGILDADDNEAEIDPSLAMRWVQSRFLPREEDLNPALACTHLRDLLGMYGDLPPQGSAAWLASREQDVITASWAGDCLETGARRRNRLNEKTGAAPKHVFSQFVKNIMNYGNDNEDRGLALYHYGYTKQAGQIFNLGLVRHPKYPWLGGSPDGVWVRRGGGGGGKDEMVLLEVKCPPKRKIVRGLVPKGYIVQVQLLMQILDLPRCDFIQWKGSASASVPQVMDVTRIERDDAWFADALPKFRAFYDEWQAGKLPPDERAALRAAEAEAKAAAALHGPAIDAAEQTAALQSMGGLEGSVLFSSPPVAGSGGPVHKKTKR